MILKIELENFFSIKDRIIIDFCAANIDSALTRELSHNVMMWKDIPVLKSIGLFGPNASGKSNILKAISFCCRMVLESHFYNEGVVFNFEPFKFDDCSKKPSRFLINFICDEIEYEYSFELTKTKIISESLYHYPKGKRAKVFTREATNTYDVKVFEKPSEVTRSTSEKNLFLSRASSMNRELAQKLYNFFLEKFMLGLVNINEVLLLDSFNKYKKIILKALEISDSDITDIEVRTEQIPVQMAPLPGQTELTYKLADILRFKTFHRGNKEVMFDMDMEESGGTRKLFQILLRLLDVIKHKKAIQMDEFDMGLHTRLADFVLDLIHASEGSQLLFTSHNTNLLDIKRLRRDQIVFVNKTPIGATEVYSLVDFSDFRENMNAEKGYLQGRFDAVPYIDSSVESINDLLKD